MENQLGAAHRPALLSMPGVPASSLPAGVGEVVIRSKYVGTWNPVSWAHDPDARAQMLPEADVLAQIAAHRAHGVAALLVVVESNGGTTEAARAIYDALRAFSDAGGTVVVHLVGGVASNAPLYAVAGDCIIVDQTARLFLHSAFGPGVKWANAWSMSVLASRTLAPPASIAFWNSLEMNAEGRPYCAELDAAASLYYGFADAVGTYSHAKGLAATLAQPGAGFASPRSVGLRSGMRVEAGPIEEAEDGTGKWIRMRPATALVAFTALPSNVPSGLIQGQSLTVSLRNFHNLWPNPTSEFDPPDGASVPNDGSTPEFDFRVNVGTALAKAGGWVRVLSKTAAGAGEEVVLTLRIPAVAGENYRMSAFGKWVTTGGTPTGSLRVRPLDQAFSVLSGTISQTLSTSATSWTAIDLTAFTCPAGTVWMEFALRLSFGAAGTAEIWFDEIQARRMIVGNDIADLTITNDKLSIGSSARYHRSTAQTIAHNTLTIVDFFTKDWDLFNHVTTGASWKYTAPLPGKYRVSAGVSFDGAGDSTDCYLTVCVNGVEHTRLARRQVEGDFVSQHFLNLVMLEGCCTLNLNNGEYFDIRLWQSSFTSASRSTEASAVVNWVCVEQLYGPKHD